MSDSARTRSTLFPHSLWRNFLGQFNVAFISIRCYFSQEQSASNSCHTIFAFILQLLLKFIELKYQGKDNSPFDTHPKTMSVAITSLLMYCLAFDAELRVSSIQPTFPCGRAVHHSMVLFKSLSVASLASILFPDRARPVLYVLYILLSAGELLQWIHRRTIGNRCQEMRFQGSRRVQPSIYAGQLPLQEYMVRGHILPL
uniref:Uncharacterized protein n=1 Tax=Davidia involucrata TaxID=16924 RepID=A0A5B7CCL4_DAVIN